MVSYIVVALVSLAVGFVIGGLVVKNNITKVNAAQQKIDSTVAAVQQVATDIKKV